MTDESQAQRKVIKYNNRPNLLWELAYQIVCLLLGEANGALLDKCVWVSLSTISKPPDRRKKSSLKTQVTFDVNKKTLPKPKLRQGSTARLSRRD